MTEVNELEFIDLGAASIETQGIPSDVTEPDLEQAFGLQDA